MSATSYSGGPPPTPHRGEHHDSVGRQYRPRRHLRNARGVNYPSPLEAALVAETAGADLITLHLREDRRHIKDEDVRLMRRALKTA